MRLNPQETADLVIFTEKILNEKFNFLCSVRSLTGPLIRLCIIARGFCTVKDISRKVSKSCQLFRENLRFRFFENGSCYKLLLFLFFRRAFLQHIRKFGFQLPLKHMSQREVDTRAGVFENDCF